MDKIAYWLSLVVVPLIVALGTSWTTLYFGNRFQNSLEDRKSRFDYENSMLDRRLDSLKALSRLFGERQGLQDLWVIYNRDAAKCKNAECSLKYIEISEKLGDYKSQFDGELAMATLLFGPSTRSSIKKLASRSSPWWEKTQAEADLVTQSMANELTYGLERFSNDSID